MAELEARIDEALVIARASEKGVHEVGEVALDAARQARRAAEAAEESARAAAAVKAAGPGVDEQPSREVVVDPLQRFNERADAVAARLRKLERVPV